MTMTTKGDLVRKYRWLLSELHAGNEFSKDNLWKWLKEVEYLVIKEEMDNGK